MTSRYSRSILFAGIGEEGQRKVRQARLAIVGAGAIGTVAAEIAVRAGFGRVSLIDRDVVEESNLQRQFLFDEDDARSVAPKAEAAAARLRRLNSEVDVWPAVADLSAENVEEYLTPHDQILDSCDNFETRLLISDFGKKFGIPTISAACVDEVGVLAVSRPEAGWPCLRCYLEALPPAGSGPTCDTAGVIPSLPPLMASLAMSEALRIAVGRPPSRGVLTLSVWADNVSPARTFTGASSSPACPVCAGERFPALESGEASGIVKLCGRASVQVRPLRRLRPDFDLLEKAWSRVGRVRRSAAVLSAEMEEISLTLFADGRCLVRGTDDLTRAKNLYARYVGN